MFNLGISVATLIFLSVPALAAVDAQKLKIILPNGEDFLNLNRTIASEGYQDAALEIRYITVGDKNGAFVTPKVEAFDLSKWRASSDGARLDYLKKFYYANTRDFSHSGLRHVACFNGFAPQIVDKFFDGRIDKNRIRNVPAITASFSSDWGMLGMQFSETVGNQSTPYFFRMSSCEFGGKNGFIAEANRHTGALVTPNGKERDPAAERASNAVADDGTSQEFGFTNTDAKFDAPGSLVSKLPTFALRADYDKAAGLQKPGLDQRPWKGMDIRDPKEARKLTLMLFAYFFEGMADQDKTNPDNNLIAANNKNRYWCHMPWLNVGPSGREGVHGLTNERPLAANAVYPDAKPGADWGIGYYNAVGCQAINQVFGTATNVKPTPDFDAGRDFKDGTVSVKTLFTTADFASLKGTFEWHANVSEPQSNDRDVKSVRMLQIDISLKDASVKGMNPKMSNWLMTSFYFDKTYNIVDDAESLGIGEKIAKSLANVPASMLMMRPIGVQTGFEGPAADGKFADSMIFAGSQTNQTSGRLNGPADNPKSSCLSCHGTAGTRVFMAPGFMNNEAIEPYRTQMLDFSQQLALAKRNYETRMRKDAN